MIAIQQSEKLWQKHSKSTTVWDMKILYTNIYMAVVQVMGLKLRLKSVKLAKTKWSARNFFQSSGYTEAK